MLPVMVPQSFFKVIQKIITKFIWQNKKPRLKMALISRKRQHGGLTAPDILRYYKAVTIARMIEWTKENKEKKWIEMENTLSKTTLHKNIWISNKHRVLDSNTHEVTKNVFRIWDALHRKYRWAHNSPLIPLTGTKFFPPGEEIFRRFKIKNPLIKDITRKGKLESAQKLETKLGGKLRNWEYLQLNHLINTSPHPFRDGEKLDRLEKLCITPMPLKGGISKVYDFLTD